MAAIVGMDIAVIPILVRMSEVGPITTGFYGFFIAFPFLIIWMVFDHIKDAQHKAPRTQKDYYLIWTAGTLLAIDTIFWYGAMVKTSIVNTILLNNLVPIFVAIGCWIFYREKPTLSLLLSILIAIIGSAILMRGTIAINITHIVGDFMSLLSAIFYAGYVLVTKELRKSFKTSAIIAWSTLPAMYLLAIVAYRSGETMLPQTLFGWEVLFCLGIVVYVLCQGVLTFSIGYMPATIFALLMNVSSILAAVIAWMFFREQIDSLNVMGGAIILFAVIMARLVTKTDHSNDTTP